VLSQQDFTTNSTAVQNTDLAQVSKGSNTLLLTTSLSDSRLVGAELF